MRCPHCNNIVTEIKEHQYNERSTEANRKYKCLKCDEYFETIETRLEIDDKEGDE